jgi:hypothetical protein
MINQVSFLQNLTTRLEHYREVDLTADQEDRRQQGQQEFLLRFAKCPIFARFLQIRLVEYP